MTPPWGNVLFQRSAAFVPQAVMTITPKKPAVNRGVDVSVLENDMKNTDRP